MRIFALFSSLKFRFDLDVELKSIGIVSYHFPFSPRPFTADYVSRLSESLLQVNRQRFKQPYLCDNLNKLAPVCTGYQACSCPIT